MSNLNLIILSGGNSSEREVSISTGKSMYDSLVKTENVKLLEFQGNIEKYIPQLKTADLVISALHGGEGENGRIQSVFEKNDIRYTGSNSNSSALAMDKNQTKIIANNYEISTPKWIMYNSEIGIENQLDGILNLGFPLVVKPADEGSTMGLKIIQKESQILDALNFALKFSDSIMLEEFIPGRELTVGILGSEFLPIVEIIPSHELYDYECKYTTGMSNYICPAIIENSVVEKIQRDALSLHEKLGCK